MDAPVINTSDAVCIPQKQSNVSRSHRAKLNKPEEPDVDNLCQGDTKSLFTLCEDEAETKYVSRLISTYNDACSFLYMIQGHFVRH